MTATVKFRDIPGYPGYRAGDDGSIWTRRAYRGLGIGLGAQSYLGDTWRIKKPLPGKDGYPQVSLAFHVEGRRRQTTTTKPVHRLVLSAFAGPRPPGKQTRHLNGDRTDNRASNLAWGTAKENIADRDRHGTTARGERGGRAKLTAESVREIRRLNPGEKSWSEIGRLFGISKRQAGRILKGEGWATAAHDGGAR